VRHGEEKVKGKCDESIIQVEPHQHIQEEFFLARCGCHWRTQLPVPTALDAKNFSLSYAGTERLYFTYRAWILVRIHTRRS
jgi:hypothetical protein